MALNAFLRLKGQKTGEITGSATQRGQEGKIMVIAASHEITGHASGKRQHKPFIITKEIDQSSPTLQQVMATSEVLTDFILELWSLRSPREGDKVVQKYTVRLTNANIASIGFRVPNTADRELSRLVAYEEIAFTYQKIEWTWTDGGITAVDDWEPRR